MIATDQDAKDGFGKLKFELDEEDGTFMIDQTTGQLILADELDYERKTDYTVNCSRSIQYNI